jgi:LmbE family N-acetylglucosaminyl deacetylase
MRITIETKVTSMPSADPNATPLRRWLHAWLTPILATAVVLTTAAQIFAVALQSSPDISEFDTPPGQPPLPQDTGLAGLKAELLRLQTTARLLHTTAHPDDEDGGMLTLESRGRGVSAELLTLTRGEGGQNRLGSNLFDELGALRTLELLASDRYYAVQQRFTRAVDFGFSKTPQESLEKWSDPPPQLQQQPLGAPVLADVVRVIRTFRPDVIVSRFEGSARDGHGHHQAAAILTRQAFRAAADPNAFPEQIAAGLAPWQAKKLYIDIVGKDQDYTLALDTAVVDSALGMSYQQFAMQGLRHQLSQGAADWHLRTGEHYYKLVDSAPAVGGGEKEKDFFDGIDTSLPALATRLGPEQTKIPELKRQLAAIADFVAQANTALAHGSEPALQPVLVPLVEGYELLKSLITRVEVAELQPSGKQDLLVNLATKAEQFRHAIELASGINIEARLDESAGSAASAGLGVVIPGSTVAVSVRVELPGDSAAKVIAVEPSLPRGWKYRSQMSVGAQTKFRISVPADAALTRPFYHRDSPQQALYTIDDPTLATLPLTPWPMRVKVRCKFAQGSVEFTRVVEAKVRGAGAGATADASVLAQTRTLPVAVAPAASVMMEPAMQVVPLAASAPVTLSVSVQSHVAKLRGGRLQVHAPAGWEVEPKNRLLSLMSEGVSAAAPPGTSATSQANGDGGRGTPVDFKLIKAGAKPGRYKLNASLTVAGKRYDQAVSLITRNDLGAFYYYQPASAELTLLDVKVPSQLAVGYIVGAGDEVPIVLKQIGVNVSIVSPEELAQGDLGRYRTIILGIRAYDVRDDVRRYNGRLLEFVRRGGTLIVQYNTSVAEFNSGRYTPYPMTLGRERVTDEHSPVELLAPNDEIFRSPNLITPSDFDGWIQERGLYFMHSWDAHDLAPGAAPAAPEGAAPARSVAQSSPCSPLLAMNDPGEPPLAGSLVRCAYGQGTYIYTGLAFFRQLPSGVPGAIRLFVNLLDAGHSR